MSATSPRFEDYRSGAFPSTIKNPVIKAQYVIKKPKKEESNKVNTRKL
jgi:hypothetical protein